MEAGLRHLMWEYKIHYVTQAQLAHRGCTTVWEFAEFFEDKRAARDSCDDLAYSMGAGWSIEGTMINSARIATAWAEAKTRTTSLPTTPPQPALPPDPGPGPGEMERQRLEDLYASSFQRGRPHLLSQLNDIALKWQFEEIHHGRVGEMPTTMMIPYPSEEDLKLLSVKEQTAIAGGPYTEPLPLCFHHHSPTGALRRIWHRFKTNFMMALSGNAHVAALQISMDDIDALYSFIEGPQISAKVPTPSAAFLRKVERAIWRDLAYQVYKGTPLRVAMKAAIGDHVRAHAAFRESENIGPTGTSRMGDKDPGQMGSRDGTHRRAATGYSPYRRSAQGPSRHADESSSSSSYQRDRSDFHDPWEQFRPSRGSGAYPRSQWSSHPGTTSIDSDEIDKLFHDGAFSAQASNGKAVCVAHQKGLCRNPPGISCGHSHACPRILRTGHICGGAHRGLTCWSWMWEASETHSRESS